MFQSICEFVVDAYQWVDFKSMEIVFTLFGDKIGF
jgi:hypothetical protein